MNKDTLQRLILDAVDRALAHPFFVRTTDQELLKTFRVLALKDETWLQITLAEMNQNLARTPPEGA